VIGNVPAPNTEIFAFVSGILILLYIIIL